MGFAMCLCIYLLSSTSNLKVSRLKNRIIGYSSTGYKSQITSTFGVYI